MNRFISISFDKNEQDIWSQTQLYKINDLDKVMEQLKRHIHNYTDAEVFQGLYRKHPYVQSFACNGCAYFTLHLINLMKIYKYPIGKIIVIMRIKDKKKPIPINNLELSNDFDIDYEYIHLTQIVQVGNNFFSLEKSASNFLSPIDKLISHFNQSDKCKHHFKCFFYITPEESYTPNTIYNDYFNF